MRRGGGGGGGRDEGFGYFPIWETSLFGTKCLSWIELRAMNINIHLRPLS